MVCFRKRLTPEVLGVANEMILSGVRKESPHDDDDDPPAGGNGGTVIVDATCVPSHIRYPQDASLLNVAQENTEKLLDEQYDPADDRKPPTYRKQAHRDFLQFSRSRKQTTKKIRKVVGQQLRYLAQNLAAIDQKLALVRVFSERENERLTTIRTLYAQQKGMNHHFSPIVIDRIASVSQPFLRPIVRGKSGKNVEFGAKLDISVADGCTRREYFSFDTYNEAGNLPAMAERFREREGHCLIAKGRTVQNVACRCRV